VRPISFKRHRFPPDVIRYAVWLYFRFTLSIRDVEELLAQRGIEVSREAVRCWVIKFGPLIAANLRRRRSSPTGRWHLDEMVVRIRGRRMFLWRAVDVEGEVLDVLVQKRQQARGAEAAAEAAEEPGDSSRDDHDGQAGAPRPATLAWPAAIDPAACAKTTGRKTPTWRSDDESGSSRSSSPRAQPSASFPVMPPSTTPSVSSPISSPDMVCASCERRLSMPGRPRPSPLDRRGRNGALTAPSS
jgi:hypothetical protein